MKKYVKIIKYSPNVNQHICEVHGKCLISINSVGITNDEDVLIDKNGQLIYGSQLIGFVKLRDSFLNPNPPFRKTMMDKC